MIGPLIKVGDRGNLGVYICQLLWHVTRCLMGLACPSALINMFCALYDDWKRLSICILRAKVAPIGKRGSSRIWILTFIFLLFYERRKKRFCRQLWIFPDLCTSPLSLFCLMRINRHLFVTRAMWYGNPDRLSRFSVTHDQLKEQLRNSAQAMGELFSVLSLW